MTTNNKNLIDRVDNAILKFNKKIATNYVNISGRSKADLEEELYCGSAIILGLNTFVAREYILSIPAAITAIKAISPKLRPRQADYENPNRNETYDEILKYTNSMFYLTGALNIAVGAGGIIAGAITKDTDIVKGGFRALGLGVGVFGWMSADYISRVELDQKKDETQ